MILDAAIALTTAYIVMGHSTGRRRKLAEQSRAVRRRSTKVCGGVAPILAELPEIGIHRAPREILRRLHGFELGWAKPMITLTSGDCRIELMTSGPKTLTTAS